MDFDDSFEDKNLDTEDNDELESRLYAEIYYKNDENANENTDPAIPEDSYLNNENSHPRQKEFPVWWNRYHESAVPPLNAPNDRFQNRENYYNHRGKKFGNKQTLRENPRYASPSNTARNNRGQARRGGFSNRIRNSEIHVNDIEESSDVITYDDSNPSNFKTPANSTNFHFTPYHKNYESNWRVEGSPNAFYKPLDDEVPSSSIVENPTRKSFPEAEENLTKDSDVPDTASKIGNNEEPDSRDSVESSNMPKTAEKAEEVKKGTSKAPEESVEEANFRNSNSDEEESKYEVNSKETKVMKVEARREERQNLSDSDESIFEVPVPPKPKPAIIQLQDSDEEIVVEEGGQEHLNNEEEYGSVEEGKENVKKKKSSSGEKELKKKKKKKKKKKQKNEEIEINEEEEEEVQVQVEKKRKKTVPVQENDETEGFVFNFSNSETRRVVENCVPSDPETSQNLVSDDLVLNCTILQRGASSLEEIKALHQNAAGKEASAWIDMESQLSRSRAEQNHVDRAVSEMEISNTSPNVSSKVSRKRLAESPRKEASSSKKRKLSPPCSSLSVTIQNERAAARQGWAEYFFRPMSENMKHFYNSTNMETDCTVEEIQNRMSRDPNRWAILDDDIRTGRIQRNTSNMRCTLCRQCGHVKAHCPKKKKRLCYMCGNFGHSSFRCSQRMCLTCGKKQSTYRETCEVCRHYQCILCNSQGHLVENCPEHWRKYHQSINTAEFLVPENPETVMKPAHLLSCCNCAKRGHDVSTCREYRWSKHYRTPMNVQNYTVGPVYYVDAVVSTYNPEAIIRPATSPLPRTNATTDNNLSPAVPEDPEPNDPEPEELQPVPAVIDEDGVLLFEIRNILKPKGKVQELEDHQRKVSGNKNFDLNGVREGRVSPTFLNLLKNELSFHVRIFMDKDGVHMSIRISDTHYPLVHHMLYLWLSVDEFDKGNFTELELPIDSDKMVKLLSEKFEDLMTDHGDPEEMLRRIDENREKLNHQKNPSAIQHLRKIIRDDEYKLLLTLQVNRLLPKAMYFIKQLYAELDRIRRSKRKRLRSMQYLMVVRCFVVVFLPRVPLGVEEMIAKYYQNREQGVPEKLSMQDITEKKVKKIENKVTKTQTTKKMPKKVKKRGPIMEPQEKCPGYLKLQESCRNTMMQGCRKDLGKVDPRKSSDDDVQVVEDPPEIIEILDDDDEDEVEIGTGGNESQECQEVNEAKRAKVLARAKRAVANARKLNLPHMYTAANEVQKKINDFTIRPKHVKQLNKLINAEWHHLKEVGAVMHQLN